MIRWEERLAYNMRCFDSKPHNSLVLAQPASTHNGQEDNEHLKFTRTVLQITQSYKVHLHRESRKVWTAYFSVTK